jgi:hypothetical protein
MAGVDSFQASRFSPSCVAEQALQLLGSAVLWG